MRAAYCGRLKSQLFHTTALAAVVWAGAAQAQTANVTIQNVNAYNLLAPLLALNATAVGQATLQANLQQVININNAATATQQAMAISDKALPGSGSMPNITLANAFPEALRVESRNITVIDRNLRTPYNQQWTIGVQRELATDLVLDMAYLGNKGTSLISGSQKNINQPPPGPGLVAARRPYPNFASISPAAFIASQSDLLPMMIPTSGFSFDMGVII